MKKDNHPVEGPDGLVRTARLPLSSATLNWLADLIRGHCKKIRSRWRALPSGKIAAILLAVLRCDQRPGDLAGGNGIHRTTVTRRVREVVGLLAARAPRLDRALKKIAHKGGGVVLLDGTLIRTRRRTGKENRKNYSGKSKCHGLLVIALTDDRGRLLWVSAARPGRTSEITACRHDQLTAKLRAAGLVSPTLLRVLDRLDDSPALVQTDLVDTLAMNPLAVALLGDQTRHTGLASSGATTAGSWTRPNVSWFPRRPVNATAAPRQHACGPRCAPPRWPRWRRPAE
ncbi:MmyB family transcriptional regulator [Streptomyces sp. DH10]|uniref:MmyB family transcriptional regulator n=1 Tax=Streptomyces sp. DH10 TaxID=3040121 RepID=UPI002442EEE7|nr:transposase family protein [Streptomyces sp. DH10]MDG9713627.1 transposase family protein [Streptomyces sp. DH10]